MDREEEKEFNKWLESIEFVDKTGEISPHLLTKDDSPDPEGDRGWTEKEWKKKPKKKSEN